MWLGWGQGLGCTGHSAGEAARWGPGSATDKQSFTFCPIAGTWHMQQHHTMLMLASLEASENLGCYVVVVLLHVGLRSVRTRWWKVDWISASTLWLMLPFLAVPGPSPPRPSLLMQPCMPAQPMLHPGRSLLPSARAALGCSSLCFHSAAPPDEAILQLPSIPLFDIDAHTSPSLLQPRIHMQPAPHSEEIYAAERQSSMQAATLAAAIQQTQEVGHRLPSIRTSVASPPAQQGDISLGQKIFNRFRNQEAVLSERRAGRPS